MRNQAQEYRICFREFLRKSIRIYNCREKKIYIKKERKKIIFFDIICFFLINIMKNYESFKLHILQTNKDPANICTFIIAWVHCQILWLAIMRCLLLQVLFLL